MTGEDRPMIELDPTRMCCPAHGEHLRAQWPKGAAVVMVTLVKSALESDALTAACGGTVDAPADVERINEVLSARPLCYFVERATMRRALLDAEILSIVRCDVCRRSGLGGPYNVARPRGTQTWMVCVDCALDNGEALHRARPDGNVWVGV